MTQLTRKVISALIFAVALNGLCSDHKEAPAISEVPPADLADLYAFVSPNDSSKLVLALTVNPFAVPAQEVNFNFSDRIVYRFNVDNTGDAIADYLISAEFDGKNCFVTLPNGEILQGLATSGTVEPEPSQPIIFGNDQVKVFAGPRDDPFFFDFVGFNRFLAGTGAFNGSDAFGGFNCSAIVVELPSSMLTGNSSTLKIWASTLIPISFKAADSGELSRTEDRVGNPAVATALIPKSLKDAFNRTRPDRDGELYAGNIVASLNALGTSQQNIGILASVAVPDVLTINVASPTGFPNGRTLDDDVMDTLLGLILNNPAIGDSVDANDKLFLDEFPYLAAPWQPE